MSICKRIADATWFSTFIVFVILLAGILVGLETSIAFTAKYSSTLSLANTIVIWVFLLEALIKILAHGKKPWRYFMNPWNVFDFSIVVVCFLPLNASYIAVLRLARVFRVIRLITVVPRLQVLVAGLLKSIPSMFYVTLLLGLVFYVYGVIGVFLFRGNDPSHFGDLGKALVSLFRVVTLEDWTDVMYTATLGSDAYNAQGPVPVGPDPQAFGAVGTLYFMSFVIIGSMVMINLFIGVVLTSLTEAQADQLREKMHIASESEDHDIRLDLSLQKIEDELQQIKRLMRSRSFSEEDVNG